MSQAILTQAGYRQRPSIVDAIHQVKLDQGWELLREQLQKVDCGCLRVGDRKL